MPIFFSTVQEYEMFLEDELRYVLQNFELKSNLGQRDNISYKVT